MDTELIGEHSHFDLDRTFHVNYIRSTKLT